MWSASPVSKDHPTGWREALRPSSESPAKPPGHHPHRGPSSDLAPAGPGQTDPARPAVRRVDQTGRSGQDCGRRKHGPAHRNRAGRPRPRHDQHNRHVIDLAEAKVSQTSMGRIKQPAQASVSTADAPHGTSDGCRAVCAIPDGCLTNGPPDPGAGCVGSCMPGPTCSARRVTGRKISSPRSIRPIRHRGTRPSLRVSCRTVTKPGP